MYDHESAPDFSPARPRPEAGIAGLGPPRTQRDTGLSPIGHKPGHPASRPLTDDEREYLTEPEEGDLGFRSTLNGLEARDARDVAPSRADWWERDRARDARRDGGSHPTDWIITALFVAFAIALVFGWIPTGAFK